MIKKVAIIGGGQVAEKVHASYYRSRQDLELVAVVDPNQEKAQSFAERNRISHYYKDAYAMFLAEKPDIVSICTPNRYHFENVMLALSFGCDVMCEKPPALNALQAMEMMKAAQINNCILAYDFHHRFADDVRIIKEKVKEGVLGEVYVTKVHALRRCGIPGWGSFINKEMQGGGPLIDLGIHMLDSALYILDFPEILNVKAKMFQKIGKNKSEGSLGKWNPKKFSVEDSLFGFIEFKNGGILQLETSFALNIKEESVMNVEFCGVDAGATLFPAEIYTDKKGKLVTLLKKDKSDEEKHQKSMSSFVNHCFGTDCMIANGKQGYYIQRLIEALYQSAEKDELVLL